MAFEMFKPASREEWLQLRTETIGASEAPALLGVSPWLTKLSLYQSKVNPVTIEENAAMRRGRLLEPVALQILAEDHPDWQITPNPVPGGFFYRDLDLGLSCTPDAFVIIPGREGKGIIQIKSVEEYKFKKDWLNADGGIEPPLHVGVQAVQEAFLTGCKFAIAGALVVGFGIDCKDIEVPLHVGVWARLHEESKEFWRRIRDGEPPAPDFEKDAAAIAALYRDDDGSTIDLSGSNRIQELVSVRATLKEREKDGAEAERARKVVDAEIISILGNAAAGRLASGEIVEAKTTRRGGYTVEPSSFRTVKLKQPKLGNGRAA